MSKELSLVLVDEELALQTGQGFARLAHSDGSNYQIDLDDLGNIAEWLAVAWANLAGEDYRPVIITEKGYVADEGLVTYSGGATDSEDFRTGFYAERDCE